MPKAAPLSPKKKHNRKSKRVDAGNYVCEDCLQNVRNRGSGSHNRGCEPRLLRLQRELAVVEQNQHVDPDPQQLSTNENVNAPVNSAVQAITMESEEGKGLEGNQSQRPTLLEEHRNMEQGILEEEESELEDDGVADGPQWSMEMDLDLSTLGSDNSGDSDLDGLGTPHREQQVPLEVELEEEWMPISAGPGGVEHSVYQSTYEKPHDKPPPAENEIRVEYHPRSGRKPVHDSFYNYEPFGLNNLNVPGLNNGAQSSVLDKEPWRPFSTHLDFDIADFMLEASLSNRQTDSLISLFQRCISDPTSFTLTSSEGIRTTWEAARTAHNTSKFMKETIQIPYPKQDSETHVKFDTWSIPLWDWCDELLSDPDIIKEFHWDAEWVFKFKTETDSFERCISEPWTADAFWEAQSKVPEGGLPLSIILYTDKTQLSSFGTAKAYPVMARCGNLPVELRNGKGIAGGRLVGWLPIIKEDAGETGKKGYIDLKRVVWHKSFKVILKTILQYSKTGITKECGDGKTRTLYPIILILSADYEEQCYMAAIRGTNSAHPCPVCLVSKGELSDLVATPVLRTSEAMKAVYDTAQRAVAEPGTGKEKVKDGILKQYGLRNVENVFWSLRYTNVYSALSWDRLHAYHGGLFSRHLWDLFKKCVDQLGKQSGKMIDLQVDQIPRWSGLNHFSSIIKTGEYTDGRKYEDMSKIIVFASHNALFQGSTEWGYSLLQLIQSYLELDMFSSLLIHTEETINLGQQEMIRFHDTLENFKLLYPAKNWDFPKMHTHTHMFDNIRRKGATRNYNTKPNENAHRPLKSFYNRTNYKDVEKQILQMHTDHLVSLIINNQIANMAEAASATENTENDVGGPENDDTDNPLTNSHVVLGSALPPISLARLENDRSLPPQPGSPSDQTEHALTAPTLTSAATDFSPAFRNLRKRICQGLSTILSSEAGKYKKVNLKASDTIEPRQYLKVHYESVIDWELKTDHLRVSTSFHGRDRHDFVLIETQKGQFCFAQLLYMFKITYKNKIHALALVLPMDKPVPHLHRARNRDLRFTRVFARSMAEAVVIDVRAITRGALLIRDYGMKDSQTFIVADTVDADIWWRMKSITLQQDVHFV